MQNESLVKGMHVEEMMLQIRRLVEERIDGIVEWMDGWIYVYYDDRWMDG